MSFRAPKLFFLIKIFYAEFYGILKRRNLEIREHSIISNIDVPYIITDIYHIYELF